MFSLLADPTQHERIFNAIEVAERQHGWVLQHLSLVQSFDQAWADSALLNRHLPLMPCCAPCLQGASSTLLEEEGPRRRCVWALAMGCSQPQMPVT
jgi:hypothetical protein